MIDLTINKTGLEHNIQKAKENHIIIPTIAQMQNPDLIPEKIKAKLSHTGLWDVDPVNLFRISWHNEAKEQGGLFQAVPNYVEIPSKLSGVPCRIIAMSGKWFPTGCHKVGASFGCLPPAWSPVSSTPPITTPSGPPPATTAAAAPSTPSCWPASPWPSCPRICPRSVLTG